METRLAASSLTSALGACVLDACASPGPLAEGPEPAATSAGGRVFLESVTVEGFRGVGAPLTLSVKPGPGLSVIVGRNGTGKSSLSDALEVLFTGSSARWASKKTKVWQDGWRNLHHPDPVEVKARAIIEGQSGYVTVTRQWAAGADLASSVVTVARPGKPLGGLDSLGWDDALVSYRPFLSYSELGGLLEEGPSKLFDALNAILGLEDLSLAVKALAADRLEIERRGPQTAAELLRFRALLEASRDERAEKILAALPARSPDLDLLATLIEPTGDAAAGGDQLELLHRLAVLDPPTADELAGAAQRLLVAAADEQTASSTDAGRARAVAGLLDAAVDFHDRHGPGDCPVCGQVGGLSADWHARADAERAYLRRLASDADVAHRRLVQAITDARALLRPPPAVLADAASAGIDARVALAEWEAWAAFAADGTPGALAAHLGTVDGWRDDVTVISEEAGRQLAAAEDLWRPVAEAGMAWLGHAEADRRDAPRAKDLKTAEAWLKKTEAAIRDERFEPLAGAATEVWKALRQRSSVDIGGITLSGTATSRRVAIDVSVDGSPGAALAVMSQGELHALALALFFPRATLAESPFRFVVIDDPVQAMDLAKVEGLARVLEVTAATHQVIVLTHDDRLPEAVRRLRIPATIVEVYRGTGSDVVTAKVLDPVDRHLRDARNAAVAVDLPSEVKARVVPTLCRQALEAICVEVVRRRRLTRGDRHEDVEKAVAGANKLSKSLALALFDDSEKGGEVLSKLIGWNRRLADTYQECNKGAHGAYFGDPEALVTDTRAFVKRLEVLP